MYIIITYYNINYINIINIISYIIYLFYRYALYIIIVLYYNNYFFNFYKYFDLTNTLILHILTYTDAIYQPAIMNTTLNDVKYSVFVNIAVNATTDDKFQYFLLPTTVKFC